MTLIFFCHSSSIIWCPRGVAPDAGPSNRQHAYQAAPGAEQMGPNIARHPALCHDASQGAQLSCVPHFACSMLKVLIVYLYAYKATADL